MLLIMLVLAGCGQPMQIGTPTQVQVRPTRLPSDSALPSITANSVPSAAPSAQATSELDITPFATAALEPTVQSAPTVTVEMAATPTRPPAATPTPAVIVVPLTQMPETNEQRWRAQQQERTVNDPPRIYVVPSPATLWWYDPLTS